MTLSVGIVVMGVLITSNLNCGYHGQRSKRFSRRVLSGAGATPPYPTLGMSSAPLLCVARLRRAGEVRGGRKSTSYSIKP